MRRLLADRNLRRLFVGQFASLLGDSMMLLVLGVWVKDITGSSAAAGAMILLIVAPALGAPLAGYVVDRVRRRRFLVVANLLSALIVLPLLAVGDDGPTWILYLVAVLYGVSFAVLGPGMSALLQAVVPPTSSRRPTASSRRSSRASAWSGRSWAPASTRPWAGAPSR